MSNSSMRQGRISGRPLIYTHLVFSQRASWHICLLPLSQASYNGTAVFLCQLVLGVPGIVLEPCGCAIAHLTNSSAIQSLIP